MALTIEKLKHMFDKSFQANQVTRERASDDIVFSRITQWDDTLLEGSDLTYKGEFNIIRKAERQISSDLRQNPVQVNFEPKASSREDGGELLDGLYRTTEGENTSQEGYNNASNECITCGVGAWELITEYETNNIGDENQKITRKPIYEANNNCFWDSNAKLQDKSDAKHVAILEGYSHEGYEALVEDLTGSDDGISMSSFSSPEHSYTFPWVEQGGVQELIYVVRFYHREKVKDVIVTLEDPLGQPIMLRASDVEEVMDDLIDEGYSIVDERKIERWQVTLYIASGAEILDSYPIAGQHIPVVPVYGERAFVEGEEHYEGIVRIAKDPQRLRNFMMSYLGDVVSRSPRPKPIFSAEQVMGYEFMYEENGSDNSYPYYLQNTQKKDGTPIQPPAIPVMPEQQVPQSVMMGLEQTRLAVDDVASANSPNDITDIDLSGKAISKIQAKLDMQSIIYQENLKFAKVRDGVIYASMASEVYDSPRTVTLTLPDGTRKTEQIMSSVMDKDSGEMVMLNDMTNQEFDVYGEIGAVYNTVKQETLEQLGQMAQMVAPVDPKLMTALLMKQMTLIDGVAMGDIRDYARKQLVIGGFTEPKDEEEAQMLQQHQEQQGQEQDPAMALAGAEQAKADASMAEVQRKAQADQHNAQINEGKLLVEQFKAQTGRLGVQVDAKVAGASADFKRADQFQKRVDSALKNQDMRARVNQQPQPQRMQ